MKHIIMFAIIVALIIMIGLTSYQYARAMSSGAPSLNCVQCHRGAEKRPATFIIEGLPKKYTPSKIYTIIIKITNGPKCNPNIACGGFAVKVNSGKLIVTDPKDTQIRASPMGEIITHTKQGSKKREWSFEWKAPKTMRPVTFEISVLAANGDGSPLGDAFAQKIITIQPVSVTTSTITMNKTKNPTITKITPKTQPYTITTKKQEKRNTLVATASAILLFVLATAAYLFVIRK